MTVNQFKGFADAGFGILRLRSERDSRRAVRRRSSTSTRGRRTRRRSGAFPPISTARRRRRPDAPNVAIALGADFLDGSPNDLVHVWRFHADFADPGNTTFTGPVDVAIAPFAALDCGNVIGGEAAFPRAGRAS